MENTELKEVKTAAENAMKAFGEMKSMVEGFGKTLNDITPKMDAFDQAKFDRMAKDIGNAIEMAQKDQLARKAVEDQLKEQADQTKSIETELTELKTAFNRQPAPGTAEDKAAEQKALRKKMFNEFGRMRSENREGFTEYLEKRGAENAEIKALSVNSDPNGGYLTMPEMGGIIQTRVFETSPMRQLATVTTIGSDSYEVILDNDEAGSGWVGETAPRPTTGNPTFAKLTIYCNELYANPKASQKILDDAGIDLEAWLGQKVADKFARDEATAFVTGNGVNKPKGILSYAAGTDINQQQVQQVVSGNATLFTYGGLIDLQNSLKEPYQANAVFLIQRATNASLLKLVDGESRPIFNMVYDKNAGLQPTILGKSVYFAADMPSVGAGALAAAYGDFRAAYQIVDRAGIRVLRDPYTDKPNVAFYTTKRVGAGAVNFEAYKLQKIST